MDALIARARALGPSLAAHTDAHVAARQLAPEVVAALRDDAYLRMLLPRAVGGLAITPAAYLDVLAALAAGDAATAWVVMTASTSTLLAAYLPRPSAEAIWPAAGPTPLLAGVFAPGGTATEDGDALIVRGRWPYGSGCRHADWAAVGLLVGAPPRHAVALIPMTAPGLSVVDTWDPIGLAGTGSHDLVAADVRVPRAMVAQVIGATPWPDEPLTRLPVFGLLALGIAGVGLGIADGALAEVAARLRDVRNPDGPPSASLAGFASLTARLRAARAFAIDAATRALATAATAPADDATRGELRLAAAHAATEAAAVTRAAFHLIGGATIGRTTRLARAVADADVMLTHRMVADRVRPTTGRALLGLGAPPDL
ncbi:MAG: hypothetical protein R3B06_26405 [Kofleriaceae bacterium]